MIVRIMGVDNGVRRTQSTQDTSARSSNDQRVGFTGDCEGDRTYIKAKKDLKAGTP